MLDLSTEILIHSILRTLAYADVFDYPLTSDEVYRYLIIQPAPGAVVEHALNTMADSSLIHRVGDYLTLPDRESIVEIRKRRALIATRLWRKAARYGRIIASLPFVRMVAVTGSLVMSNADEGKDMDFMLVTEPGHLWTCRALSMLIVRLAKLQGVSLCPNYLITTNALELKEHSLYVAHELAQMIPLSGAEIYAEMRRLNQWTDEYLPNAQGAPFRKEISEVFRDFRSLKINRMLEFLLRLFPFNMFEKWEMNRKIRRLTLEQSSSSEAYFSADICKGHVDRHGEKTEQALKDRLQNLESNYLFNTKDVNVS